LKAGRGLGERCGPAGSRTKPYISAMPLRDYVTEENVLAFAKAGIDIARAAHRLRDAGYESMIVPSRGAVPFLRVATSYYRSIVVPSMPRKDRWRIGARTNFGPLTLSLDVPFTADVCRIGHHDSLEWRMESERFLFIDTVVSGRAVSEIVEAFEAEGLDQIHYILLLDEKGAAMKPPYAARISAWRMPSGSRCNLECCEWLGRVHKRHSAQVEPPSPLIEFLTPEL
jgi:hypothetical protein